MKYLHVFSFLAFAYFPATTQASLLTFNGSLDSANEVDQFSFNITTSSSINLYTSSFFPLDPFLTLWKSIGSGFEKVAFNDNRETQNFFETINDLDSKIVVNLPIGSYLATVSGAGNVPNGNLLSAGFSNGGSASNTGEYELSVDITALPPTPVPLPAMMFWMFGAGLFSLYRVGVRKTA